MPLVLQTVEVDGKTYALLHEGKPLYKDGDKDVPFDADQAVTKISALNREAQTHREEKEKAQTELKKFEGIEDPAKALDALKTVENMGAGELKTAAQVEELKAGVEKAMKANFENQIRELTANNEKLTGEIAGLKSSLDDEVIGGAFARSKFINEKLILPPDIAEATFRKHFALEDGRMVAKDAAGGKLFSRDPNRIGQDATFEEAMEQLVESYPMKASILKGSGHSGSDAKGPGASTPGAKTILRAEFDRLPADQQMAKIRDGWKPVDA